MSALRHAAVAPRDAPDRVGDEVVRKTNHAPSVAATLTCQRLGYAARVTKEAPDSLLALIQNKPGAAWRSVLIEDMVVMRSVLAPKLDEFPCPRVSPQVWEAWWSAWPQHWKRLVSCLRTKLATAGLAALLTQPDQTADADPAPEAAAAVAPCDVARAECDHRFASPMALSSHAAAAHGVRRWARWYAGANGVCSVCGWCFRTRPRLIAHLQHSSRRCANMISLGAVEPYDDDTVADMDEADRVANAAMHKVGALPCSGLPAFQTAPPTLHSH